MRHLLLVCLLVVSVRCVLAQQTGWDVRQIVVSRSLDTLPQEQRAGISNALRTDSKNLRVTVLATHGHSLFLVRTNDPMDCSPTGNCPTWVLSDDYHILLETIAQTLGVSTTQHNGLPDIISRMHGSAFDGDLTRWEFGRTTYTAAACVNENYADANGNTRKTPKITIESCVDR
jgi:hypothetical protein